MTPLPAHRQQPLLFWSTLVLSVLGAADAIYLLVLKYSGDTRMCLGSGECATVNASRYSTVYGIPVALLGTLAYLAIVAILALEPNWKFARRNGPLGIFGIGLAGVVFSAYLTYIELYVIDAVCPFCLISAVLILLIFVIAILRMVMQNEL